MYYFFYRLLLQNLSNDKYISYMKNESSKWIISSKNENSEFKDRYNTIHTTTAAATTTDNSYFVKIVALRPKIKEVVSEIDKQIRIYEKNLDIIRQIDNELYKKCSILKNEKRNIQYLAIVSSDLKKNYDNGKLILIAILVLQKIKNRFENVKDFQILHEIVLTSIVAIKIIRSLVYPFSNELNIFESITNNLMHVLLDAGQINGSLIDFKTANKNAEYLLDEITKLAEKRSKDEFHEPPNLSLYYNQIN